MPGAKPLDCVLVGYNEPPFEMYESRIRGYGEDSEAYRDLKLNFVNLDGRKLTYMNLMNHGLHVAQGNGGPGVDCFKCGEIPNLAAVYLANFAKRQGIHAEYVNLFQYDKDRLRELLDEGPLCVGITTTLYVLNFEVIEIVDFIREHNSETKIVVGGPLIANHARGNQGEKLKLALTDTGADIWVVEGQGEATFVEIVKALKNGGDLSKVPNIFYLDGDEIRRTPTVPENNDMNEVFIDWADFKDSNLGPTIQTRTARSCAFSCAFCNYPTRAGKLTLASVETIGKELDALHNMGGVKNIVFIDDTFNVPLPRFKDICRMMIDRGYNFNWFSYFRCSNSDDEAFDLMAESGCKGVFLGIESGSPQILTNMNKRATIEKYFVGIEKLRQRDILTFGSFILGFPGETSETVKETFDFIKESRPTYYRTLLWYNEPGTPIKNRTDEFEISGEGFVWEHSTMDSLEASDHIDRIFLGIKESLWLPQYSYDFWAIPYLMGKGLSLAQIENFVRSANEMLRLEIASLPPAQKRSIQSKHMQELIAGAAEWGGGELLS